MRAKGHMMSLCCHKHTETAYKWKFINKYKFDYEPKSHWLLLRAKKSLPLLLPAEVGRVAKFVLK